MLKDRLASLIGRDNYVRYVMHLTNLRQAFRPFRHPAAPLMERLLMPRGGVVFDIGANIGRCTALAARCVGPSGRVYSFEPVPSVLKVLRTMVRLRKLQQVTIVEAALSNENGSADISIPLKDGWKPLVPIAHLSAAPEQNVLNLTIATRRMDEYCEAESVSRIDFIKCDTEGSEFSVFSGGLARLTSDLPAVICEVYEKYLSRQGAKPSDVFGIFDSLGYDAYLINPDGTLRVVSSYATQGDYLFAHPDRLKAARLKPFLQVA